MISSRTQRVIEIVEAVQSDLEQIILLLKMPDEDYGCTRTNLDESANEKLKMFIQGLSYRKPNSEG